MPERASRQLGLPLFDAQCRGRPFVLEGGGIEVNGRGTLITTEECYLDTQTQVRNPGLSREDYETALRDTWASGTSSGWATASPATTRTGTWTTCAGSSIRRPSC